MATFGVPSTDWAHLSRAGVAGWDCPRLMPKVCLFLSIKAMLDYYVRCDAPPENLDVPDAHHRSHEKTDFLINCFHPDVVWSQFGIQSDVVVWTCT
jgi:hypothetical protein